MKVKLIAYTPNPEKVVATAAKLCYSSSDISTLQDNLTDENIKKFVSMLANIHHESPFEHISFTFGIEGVSRSCYDKETMVLTNNGWKYFKNIDINSDLFCSINNNNEIEYVKAIEKIEYDYQGKLDKYKSTQIDLCVTPNHKMWVFDYEKRSPDTKIWKFIESKDVVNCRYGFEKSSKGIITPDCKSIIIPSVERQHHKSFNGFTFENEQVNLFLEFLGIWVTDGSLSFGIVKNGKQVSGNRIQISQTKSFGRKKLEYLLSKLNINYTCNETDYRISNQPLFDWLATNFIQGRNTHKSYYLTLPRWMFTDLSISNMRHFLYGVFIGNGSHHTFTHEQLINKNISIFDVGAGFNIYTASENFANDLVEMALLCGLCGNKRLGKIRPRTFPNGHTTVNCVQPYIVSILTQGYHLFNTRPNKSQIEYNDKVYCVELEKYHKLYVMRNGRACWCGNCTHQLVRHRIASYSQKSQRYVSEDNFEYVIPSAIAGSPYCLDVFTDTMKCINAAYKDIEHCLTQNFTKELIEIGLDEKEAKQKASKMAAENARAVLPNACETKIIVTMNARSLFNFFAHRCCNRAQDEIRELATEMYKQVYALAPNIFKYSGPNCVATGKCPEGKMCCGRMKEKKDYFNSIKESIVTVKD